MFSLCVNSHIDYLFQGGRFTSKIIITNNNYLLDEDEVEFRSAVISISPNDDSGDLPILALNLNTKKYILTDTFI